MKKILFIALFIGQLFAYTNIEATNQNIKKLQNQNIPIIDIRLPNEWKSTGTIPNSIQDTFFTINGSINPNFYKILKKHHINKNSKFAVICRTGHRTKMAIELIYKNGYKNVINLDGGMYKLFNTMLKECFNGRKK